jgi:HAD superfamily hydrolase (TIGR01549 family)
MRLVILDFFGTLGYFPKKIIFLFSLRLFLLGYNPIALRNKIKWFLTRSKSWEDLAEEITKNFGRKTDERLVKMLRKTLKVKLYDDSKGFLDYLAWKGYKMAILTNSGSFLLENCDLPGVKIFTSQIPGWKKPNRKAFLRVLKEYDSEPEDAVMIGDSWLTDILPAYKLGMEVFFIDRKGKDCEDNDEDKMAHASPSLEDIKRYLYD